jgi:hypothetical protein
MFVRNDIEADFDSARRRRSVPSEAEESDGPRPLLVLREHLAILQIGFGTAEDFRAALEGWCCRLLGIQPRPQLAL